jgi:signal transduction histidine kinase/CheY-like chemotaxis protein
VSAGRISTLAIERHEDMVAVRQRARTLAGLLGFDAQEQTRIATAVSEIARNALRYGQGGRVEFEIEGRTAPQVLIMRVRDQGPGIEDIGLVLSGRYRSETGLGLGIAGARRLVDQLDIDSTRGRGVTVVLKKLLPRRSPLVDTARLGALGSALLQEQPQGALAEVEQQNRELLRTLDELRRRQDELITLNRELEDTNRGVVALYAELDEKADHLRRADEMKSRFLSNMSHEFRTPLHSILALTRLLLDRTDGVLTAEQERQIGYVRKSADSLLELVNDLLDIAKIEAGKTNVRPVEFEVSTLFSALRGMLRPLLVSGRVDLVFAEPDGLPALYTDESKVSQILRNFISNALKFTEQGEVRVKSSRCEQDGTVTFTVSDTGIGIAPEDQASIFEEFVQLEHPLQKRVKGTGLGLPLTRRLAMLLNGSVGVHSQPGQGSTFHLTIPMYYNHAPDLETKSAPKRIVDESGVPVLVVEDQPEIRLAYQRFLRGSRFEALPVASLREARIELGRRLPRAIVLDILLRGEDAWQWLAQLKAEEHTRDIPVIVASTVDDPRKGLALGADAYLAKPVEGMALLRELERLVPSQEPGGVLLIDDEESHRYVLKRLLGDALGTVHEAANGRQGLALSRTVHPRGILLDLQMPDMTGEEVLRQLRNDPSTRSIPVALVTSERLSAAVLGRCTDLGCSVLSKDNLSLESLLQCLGL